MVNPAGKVRIQLVGPIKVVKSTGEDCTPRGRKACAVLAMLALAAGHKRSRAWVQEKLWGNRGKEQGAASLRQSLTEIRKAFGDARDCLAADSFVLSLIPNSFETDLADPAELEQVTELLEGLDIGEEGFEDWLRSERQAYDERIVAVTNRRRQAGELSGERKEQPSCQNRIVLVRGSAPDRTEASVMADSMIDTIAKTLMELGAAEVLDRRDVDIDPANGDGVPTGDGVLVLRSDTYGADTRQIVRLALLQQPLNTLAWTSTLQSGDARSIELSDADVLRCINLTVNVAIDQFVRVRSAGSENTVASDLCYSGILHLFRLGTTNFEAADQLFARAFELSPRGIYLAWRAYLRTFLLAERQYRCRRTVEAEALDFMRRSLELEPYNSYVVGLSAHVQSIMRRSYVAAYELAERSIQLNHANPVGWACLGIAKSYLGKPEEGFRDTQLARTIAGSAPFRFQIDALACIAGTMAGEVDKAIYLAETSHAQAPTFAPPMRYLSALYAHTGQFDLSFDMVRKLQATEPDFSYDKLRDKAYPAAGLHRTSIISSLPSR
jgi:tetratricopeptide (TPR) repeat protein